MALIVRSILAGIVLWAAFAAGASGPIAFVSDIKGEVNLNGGGRPPFLAELLPGSRLVLAAKAGVAVMYVVSGEEFTLKGPGEFVVTAEGVKAVKGPVPSRRIPEFRVSAAVLVQTSKAATASLRMRSAPAPSGESSGPRYPVNGRIASLQPTLRWVGERETEYTVIVTSAAGKEVFRGIAKGQSLQLPVRLAPGQGYTWGYAAGGADRGTSRFETLTSESIVAAEKARAGAKSFADRVTLALVLQELGADQDSREVWMRLAAERPDIPELAGLSR